MSHSGSDSDRNEKIGETGYDMPRDFIQEHAEGRPDIRAVIREATDRPGSVGVAACGPDSLLYDVRNAAAEAQLRILKERSPASEVYLHSECFGW